MITLLIPIHILLCVLLVISVLLQSGKGSDLASMLGGGMMSDALDSHSAMRTLARFTTVVAILFFLSSIVLALLGLRQGKSNVLDQLDNLKKKQKTEAVAPSPTPQATETEGKIEEGKAKVEGEKTIKENVSKEVTPAVSTQETPKPEGGIPELSQPKAVGPVPKTTPADSGKDSTKPAEEPEKK